MQDGPEEDPNPGVAYDELRVHGIEGLRIADTSILLDIYLYTYDGRSRAQMILQRD